MSLYVLLALGALLFTAGACMTVQKNRSAEHDMTLGVVQREIHIGMTQTQVAEVLGSPNIVTKDADTRETWIYDKIATEASYSRSDAYGNILILGVSKNAGTSQTSQRTLTVVIKFNGDKKVDAFTFHASRF